MKKETVPVEDTTDETEGVTEIAPATDDVENIEGESGASAGAAIVEPPREAVQRLTDELAQTKEQLLRTAAEFDNFRKRTAREWQEQRARARAELARSVLDAIDDLGRVAHFDPATVPPADVIQGVEMVERKLLVQLEEQGLKRLGDEGERFDPNDHEAIGTMPAALPDEDGTVGKVVQPGYRLGAMLIRPARVLVKVLPAETGEPS